MKHMKYINTVTGVEYFLERENTFDITLRNLETNNLYNVGKHSFYMYYTNNYGLKAIAYEMYKAVWKREHITSAQETNAYKKFYDAMYNTPSLTWEEFILSEGYDERRSCYASFNEFIDIEYYDQEFMKQLLSPAMYEEYLEEVTELWENVA